MFLSCIINIHRHKIEFIPNKTKILQDESKKTNSNKTNQENIQTKRFGKISQDESGKYLNKTNQGNILTRQIREIS